MPVFNGEKYIREALDSLIQQSYSNFELVISDNASTDLTEMICTEYANRDKRIKYFRQSTNVGAAANFKFVLDQASGEMFMWAAYDDVWGRDYLKKALPLFDDVVVGFVFPAFTIASIGLKVMKKFDENIFKFVESPEKKVRTLNFISLHHDSHKCNLVYSLFRKTLLQEALDIQGIGNDGALAAVILNLSQGKLLGGWLFTKRYPFFWPGLLTPIYRVIRRNKSLSFSVAKEKALSRLITLFPGDIDALKKIFDYYKPYSHEKSYQICSVDNFLIGAKSDED
jgi:glycosyltransferase involved in cell wall biosynthesis